MQTMAYIYEWYLGTHNVVDATVKVTEANGTEIIETTYFGEDKASGAFFAFIFISENGYIDFKKSALMALNMTASLYYPLPLNLCPGNYTLFVYGIDTENNGTLSTGDSYPAVARNVSLESGDQECQGNS